MARRFRKSVHCLLMGFYTLHLRVYGLYVFFLVLFHLIYLQNSTTTNSIFPIYFTIKESIPSIFQLFTISLSKISPKNFLYSVLHPIFQPSILPPNRISFQQAQPL